MAFASEMKALLALPGFRPEIDRQACYDFLGLGYIRSRPPDSRTFRPCRGELSHHQPSGHHLREYEQIAAHPDRGRTLADAVSAASGSLLAAVAAQSVADVPVAALCPGHRLVAGRRRARPRHWPADDDVQRALPRPHPRRDHDGVDGVCALRNQPPHD